MNSNKFDEYLVQVEHDFRACDRKCLKVISSDFLKLVSRGAFMMVKKWSKELMQIVQVKMSFTVRVKEELLSLKRFEKSELAAIIKMSRTRNINGGLDALCDNRKCQDRSPYLNYLHHFMAKSDIRHHQKTQFEKESCLHSILG